MKPKYHILISIIVLGCLLGLANAKKAEITRSIRWGEKVLTWDDFPVIESIPGDYSAMVYSDIQFEGNREDHSLRIYAQMIPHKSGRVVSGDEETEQLLIHEQNHFNITEYNARLFRKEVIAIGKDKLTNQDLQNLGKKYLRRIDRMQDMYDRESEHNTIWPKQRYWELYVAGLLRETAHYAEEDIYQYQEFTGGDTQWFRKVYVTLEGELLTSYPENQKNKRYGEVYQVERKKDSIIISFYKNGEAKAGGYFEAPVCIMTFPAAYTREQHFFDETGAYFSSETTVPVARISIDESGNMTRTYYDEKGVQVSREGVFTQTGKWNASQNSFYYSYFDKNGEPVTHDKAFHELREMGDNKVTRRISYFDKAGKPMLDNRYISIYEYEVNAQYNITHAKYFNVDGKLALYQDGSHTIYEYDERGNVAATSFLDERGNKAADINGIHKYTYTYDLYDNTTDVRKFNLHGLASNGADGFHHSVELRDSIGRLSFMAQYHPDYILKFSEKRDGASVFEYQGDSIIKIKNVDVYGTESDNDSGVSLTNQILDAKKQVVSEQFFNSEGYWAKTSDEVTSYKYKYDERGNQIEMAAFDSLGKPRAWEEDVAISRWEYDLRNNKTKTTYLTEENRLAEALQGTTYNTFKYDENNTLLEKAYYNKYMEPCLFDGSHRVTYLYNRFGKDSIIKTYDVNNQLIKGPSIIKYLYSDQGILLSEAFYNEKDSPTYNTSGIHKTVYNYDKNWRYIGVSYKGKYGEAVNDYQGISQIALTLTPSGYLWNFSYYDKNKNPIIGPEGFHNMYNHYNDMDEVLRTSTFGTDKKLINNQDGVADYVFSVNSSGQISRVSLYDADSNLTEDSTGVAEYYYEASLNGLFYLSKQLNAKGEEIPQSDI